MRPSTLLFLASCLLAGCDAVQQQALKTYMAVEKGLAPDSGPVAISSDVQDFEVRALTDAFDFPWGLDFLPDGRLLVTERPGRLNLFEIETGEHRRVEGTPEVYYAGQGGLLDVVVHPDFERNGWIYLSAAVQLASGKSTTRVLRYRLVDDRLLDETLIFEATPALDSRKHFGSALLFDNEGYLFLTIGDRGNRYLAQDLGTAMGKVIRLNDDGSVPPDNPFVDQPGALPGIFSWGHRNPQGITMDRATGRIWAVEHGPQGGDEINLLAAGANYGWPVVTFGEEYGGGAIGEGTHKEGMTQPEFYYLPSIATGGIAWYDGDALPGWRGSLFVAGLRSFSISRVFPGPDGLADERLLEGFSFRARNVAQGPDGLLYVVTENGGILQLSPGGGGED